VGGGGSKEEERGGERPRGWRLGTGLLGNELSLMKLQQNLIEKLDRRGRRDYGWDEEVQFLVNEGENGRRGGRLIRA